MSGVNIFLRCLRIANDLTIVQLSKIIGVSVSYICEIEKNKKNPSEKTIEKYLSNLSFSYSEMEEIIDAIDNDSLEYRKILENILKYYLDNNYDMESRTKKLKS